MQNAQDNLGVEKVSAPSKNPRNAPLYVLPQTKKIPALLESELHWYFYVPEREGEREGGKRARERGKEKERERKKVQGL